MDNDMIKSRGDLYLLLAEPFRFPTPADSEQYVSGGFGQRLAAIAQVLNYDGDYDLPLAEVPTLAVDHDSYQVEFISLYEVGMGGAPCPLHSGHYSKDRMRTLEEVVRFYQYFDFSPDRSPDRFPDHITFELEFMAHLADLQWQAVTEGADDESPLRAQRDFVARHLTSWLPELTRLVAMKGQIKFFSQTTDLLNAYAAHDQHYLDATVQPSGSPKVLVGERGKLNTARRN